MNSSDIATLMRRLIEDNQYKRFDRLPSSRELALTLGVARNTLRQALHQLEKEGLLQTRPGSGTYVTTPEKNSVPDPIEKATPLELIDARFALEPHICRLCVIHGRQDDFDTMEKLCSTMEASTSDPGSFAKADTAFHIALSMATRNRLLIWLIEQINVVRQFDKWNHMRHLTLNEKTISIYNLQHREILDAIRSYAPEQAASKMKEHLESARLSLTRAAKT